MIPKGWRQGQFWFNFLEWLKVEKGYQSEQSNRMADPFHIPDDKFNKLIKEYEEAIGGK